MQRERERKRRFGVNAIISRLFLSLSLCISISLLRPYTFFLRSLLVFKTLFEKFMLQHPTVWFDRKQLKYLSKELLLYGFLHKRSTDV